MPIGAIQPTPYPDINQLLRRLLSDVRAILGDGFVGLYLHGSLAMGDFQPEKSDIDYVVVSTAALPDATVEALSEMHDNLNEAYPHWAAELEGSYMPLAAFRRHDPTEPMHPRIERHERLCMRQHDSDWVIQRHIIRQHGVVVAGPPLRTLLDPVPPDDLRQAVLDLLWWWELQLEEPSRVAHSGYQVYAILTMCRVLYTLEHGTVVTKAAAARWAQRSYRQPWDALIERALIWQPDQPMDRLTETLAFVRFALDVSRR